MNDTYQKMFRDILGLQPPPKLMELLGNAKLVNSTPVHFHFDDKPFVVEIQYFCRPSDESNYEVDSMYYRFAVSSDGNDLLVDLKNVDLPIIQDESGSREEIGATIGDLLQAKVVL